MAEEKQSSAAAKPKEEEAPTYHVDRLTAEAGDRFGVAPHIAAGAFSGSRKKNLTIDEAERLIKDWLKQPAETDDPQQEA